jgi:hypothetical protein
MRCGRSVARLVSRPKPLLRTRSCICAVSISKVCARGGRVCCKDQRPIICRGICCLRSRQNQIRPSPDGATVRRCGQPHDPNPRHQSTAHADDHGVVITEQVVRIEVRKDRLIVRFKSASADDGSHSTNGQLLSIPWRKSPSRKSRHILIPLGVPRNEVRPIRIVRPLLSAETENLKMGVMNPRRNGLFSIGDGFRGSGRLDGGRDRDRTCDPLDVNEVLSR